jgi:hypothetical protein
VKVDQQGRVSMLVRNVPARELAVFDKAARGMGTTRSGLVRLLVRDVAVATLEQAKGNGDEVFLTKTTTSKEM